MNKFKNVIIGFLLSLLSACSTQPIQPEPNKPDIPMDSEISITPISDNSSPPAPDFTIVKSGKELKLVRVMEGGVCKNKQQGVTGLFKLYANPKDIALIKQNKGVKIFARFEQDIQHFAMLALQHAINDLDFDKLTEQSLPTELTKLFSKFILADISQFETNTSLTIEVLPLESSLNFFMDSCETPHEH